MRILARYPTRSEAEERAAFLRAHGILPHVTQTGSLLRTLGLHKDRSQAALWAVIDTQHDDALALLANPDHEIDAILDPEQLEDLETESSAAAQQLLFRGMMFLAGGLMALFAVLALAGVL